MSPSNIEPVDFPKPKITGQVIGTDEHWPFEEVNEKYMQLVDKFPTLGVVFKEEMDRALLLLMHEVLPAETPKAYIHISLVNHIGGYFNIKSNFICFNQKFVLKKDEREHLYPINLQAWSIESFRRTCRHEIAHWAVGIEHSHSNAKFKRCVEALNCGVLTMGDHDYKRSKYERALDYLMCDVRELVLSRKTIYMQWSWFLDAVQSIQKSPPKYIGITAALLGIGVVLPALLFNTTPIWGQLWITALQFLYLCGTLILIRK